MLAGYGQQKGKHLATKEDFDELVEQLQTTTAATERIKRQLSSESWAEQKKWDLRCQLYLDLLESLYVVKHISSQRFDAEAIGRELPAEYDKKLAARSEDAYQKIVKITGQSGVLLHETANDALVSLQSELAKTERAQSYIEYLDSTIAAGESAYDAVLESAKRDLQIVPSGEPEETKQAE